jgi:hypothetical protein
MRRYRGAEDKEYAPLCGAEDKKYAPLLRCGR